MQLCIFEDINYSNFEPMVFARPVYDLVCGMTSLKDKILRSYGNIKYSLHCRSYLTGIVCFENPGISVNKIKDDKCLFLNGRLLAPDNLSELIPLIENDDKVIVNGETVVAVYLSGKNLEDKVQNLNSPFSINNFNGLPIKIVDIKCVNYLWDLINANSSELVNDFEYLTNISGKKNNIGQLKSYANVVNKERIFIGENVVVKPGVVLDASNGPIYIDDKATIYPNAVLIGPVYVGKSSLIKSAATIYENVTISNTCKIGGEVEQSIFMSYSNKQHSGFIGHSYIGSWVNLGADTNCSDLKNNYSNIKITLSNKEINSETRFLGLMMGDHSKSAINTMFNTGTVIGFSCNIFASGFIEKYLPSFTWAGKGQNKVYELDKALETMRIVFSRRKIIFEDTEEKLFKTIFEITKADREKRGVLIGR